MTTTGICARPEYTSLVWMWALPDPHETRKEQDRVRAGNVEAIRLCGQCLIRDACLSHARETGAEGVIQGGEEFPVPEIPICSECPNEVAGGRYRMTCSRVCADQRQNRLKRERDRRRRRDVLPAAA